MIEHAYIGAVLGAALIIISAAYGMGKIGKAAMEAIARQPEAADKISNSMMIALAIMEGAVLFAILVCFLIVILK